MARTYISIELASVDERDGRVGIAIAACVSAPMVRAGCQNKIWSESVLSSEGLLLLLPPPWVDATHPT